MGEFGPLLHIHTALCSVLSLYFFAGIVPQSRAEDQGITHPAVPQASVDPRPVRLPVIDGTDIRFTRLSTADGLSQIKVSQILQDNQGFMWLGTQYGLNRYDGSKFKTFAHDPGKRNSLSGVFINALFKDQIGNVWIGVDQFLDKFDPATETFTHYPVDRVKHITQDRAGILWLSSPKGLYRLDPATGQIAFYRHDPADPFSLSSNDVKSSGEDRTGAFWVATSMGLDAFDRKTCKVSLHVPLHEPTQHLSFYEDRLGVFWITFAMGDGLAVFDRKANRLTRYSFHDREPPSTVQAGVVTILEDRQGNLWFGTVDSGLLKFDRERRRFIRYRNHPDNPDTLAHDRVNTLFEDREGNIWAGLQEMGVNFFASRQPPFEKFRHEPGNPSSLDRMLVSAIYEDRQGILWVGTSGGLNRIDRKTGQCTFYGTAEPGDTNVTAISEDGSGALLVGTFGQGLKRFERATGKFKALRYDPADPLRSGNDILTRLFIDRSGTLWATTFDGLKRFDPAKEQFTLFKSQPQSDAEIYLEIAEDRQGTLWIGGHDSGLHRFEPTTGQFAAYTHNLDQPGSLSDNRVNSVHVNRSGEIWVGTQNGLDKLDTETDRFTAYYERHGLAGNAVGCILEDEAGDLWMSTNKGISRFDPRTKTFNNYSVADGLPGADLTGWGACFKSPGGEMFFGGFGGATAFHPEKVIGRSYVPPIVLTDLRLSGAPVEVGGSSPLKTSISLARAITLSHAQATFSLEFAALNYLNPSTNHYRYMLEGLDRQWNEVGGNQRLVTYSVVPPGNYTFRVQASNSGGVWNEPGASLRIGILAPWWRTWWFRTTYAVLILLLICSAYRYRLYQMDRQYNLRLEERVGERTRIAQELHDTLLQGFLSASMQLDAATDGLPADSPSKAPLSRVLHLMRQVIEEGRTAVRGLRSSQDSSFDLAQAFSRIREELTVEEGIAFRVSVEGQPQPLRPVLRDEVYRIGREALTNAFRHSRATKVEAGLEYSAKQFRLLVSDNGRGIDPGVLQSGREGHWGIHGMRERAKKIGVRLNLRSRIAAGTEVELSIPNHIAFEHETSDGFLGRVRATILEARGRKARQKPKRMQV